MSHNLLTVLLVAGAFLAVALLGYLLWLERKGQRAEVAHQQRVAEIRAGVERGLAAERNKGARWVG